MSEPSQAILGGRRTAHFSPARKVSRPEAAAAPPAITLAVHDDLQPLEQEWRRFELYADCTVFQSFDWLALWQRHIGGPAGISPAVVAGRDENGRLLFLMPLAVVPGFVRRLTWLGSDLCDYNAPLLAEGFSERMSADRFRALWREICGHLQERPRFRHDIVELIKMPETVSRQANPFLALDVGLNPSGAHMTRLCGTWEEFYRAKRSSSTRRRDRTKRKRLAECGEVRFVTPRDTNDVARTLRTLIEQKTKSFAHMGIANIFERPGYEAFFFDLATNPRTPHLVHVSRLDVGPVRAAVNLGLIFRGCYYHVLASYDAGDVSRFGPGAAHLRDLMGHAIAVGCDTFDFTIGDERYKSEWSDRTLNLYDHVAPATLRGWPLAILTLGRRRLTRLIKQNPTLWSSFTRLRSMFGGKPASVADGEGGRAAGGARMSKSPPIAPE